MNKLSNKERDAWTAQSDTAYIDREEEPGQTFTESQLPHPDVQSASGIDPVVYRKMHGLHVHDNTEARPEFRGTETGVHPTKVTPGNLESFRSYPDGLPEGIE